MTRTNEELSFAPIPSTQNGDEKQSMDELERKKLKVEIAYYKRQKELCELEIQEKKAKLEEIDSKSREEAEKSKNEPNKGIKGFFKKLGDAVIKAVPHIISVVVTAVIGYITSSISRQTKVPA